MRAPSQTPKTQIKDANSEHHAGARGAGSAPGGKEDFLGEAACPAAWEGAQSLLENRAWVAGVKAVDTLSSAGENILWLVSNKYSRFLPVEIMQCLWPLVMNY